MAVNREKDRNGNIRVVVSKRWPDKSRFRRYFPNPTLAKKTLGRIEASIAMGTWQKLKEELDGGAKKAEAIEVNDPLIRDFANVYLEEYCKVRNKRPDCKEQVLESVTRILGDVPVKSLRRSHVHQLLQSDRRKSGQRQSIAAQPC